MLEKKVTNLIHDFGVPAHLTGHYFLREAIILVVKDPEYIHKMTKEGGIYDSIAKMFKSKPTRVERSIRHAIESRWAKGSLVVMHEVFGHSVDPTDAPTNNQFIAAVADYIRMEIKHKKSQRS